ncbi:glycoside hydrolase family 105 protein [Mucilaginibacter sp. OK283]|jgi:rhamnogalacturonyl hydrolase YesR|uniref:glycoside hydrolase family 88/105 protein n=1 Tax=Mucilaginibacter sp. OK283 TaxID=1881049 RepID=UPI0008C7B932|nr:glycoside hydrolase family 88 protein [Mucilaginibacter sp. OK283]SEP39959.1 Rhamnogalacturonyl hydrolase YesR [Mucilaginibacter sp. OK283]
MKSFLYLLLMVCPAIAFGQDTNTEAVVRKVADNIVQNTSFKFINSSTKEKYDSTKGLASSADIKADSKYNKWAYVNGVLAIGMVQTADVLKDKKYSEYSQHNFEFIFDNLNYFEALYKAKTTPRVEYGSVFNITNLDACGAMSAGLFDVNALAQRKDYQAYLERSAAYISTKQMRLADGTFARPQPRFGTLWADDMFMSIPFLARMGKLTGDNKYFDDAIKQVENFNKYLYDPATGLFFHNYYSDDQTNGVGHWGRSNGWIAMAQVELLNNLPANHPKRPELIKLLLRQIVGYSRYQDPTGLWHQLLDKPDSYLETSVTAMYTYAVARAVNQGWINEKYIAIAKEGWKGLTTKITVDGQLQDVCIGTNMDTDINFYYTRPTELNDTHGLGALLLAGTEMLKAERKK